MKTDTDPLAEKMPVGLDGLGHRYQVDMTPTHHLYQDASATRYLLADQSAVDALTERVALLEATVARLDRAAEVARGVYEAATGAMAPLEARLAVVEQRAEVGDKPIARPWPGPWQQVTEPGQVSTGSWFRAWDGDGYFVAADVFGDVYRRLQSGGRVAVGRIGRRVLTAADRAACDDLLATICDGPDPHPAPVDAELAKDPDLMADPERDECWPLPDGFRWDVDPVTPTITAYDVLTEFGNVVAEAQAEWCLINILGGHHGAAIAMFLCRNGYLPRAAALAAWRALGGAA